MYFVLMMGGRTLDKAFDKVREPNQISDLFPGFVLFLSDFFALQVILNADRNATILFVFSVIVSVITSIVFFGRFFYVLNFICKRLKGIPRVYSQRDR